MFNPQTSLTGGCYLHHLHSTEREAQTVVMPSLTQVTQPVSGKQDLTQESNPSVGAACRATRTTWPLPGEAGMRGRRNESFSSRLCRTPLNTAASTVISAGPSCEAPVLFQTTLPSSSVSCLQPDIMAKRDKQHQVLPDLCRPPWGSTVHTLHRTPRQPSSKAWEMTVLAGMRRRGNLGHCSRAWKLVQPPQKTV